MLYHVIPRAILSLHPCMVIPCHQPMGLSRRSLTTVGTRVGNAFWARKVSGAPRTFRGLWPSPAGDSSE